ncbi:hypothetical protein AMTRI_Chr08g161790 [Amborella trichopoda]
MEEIFPSKQTRRKPGPLIAQCKGDMAIDKLHGPHLYVVKRRLCGPRGRIGILQLTNVTSGLIGRAFYPEPLQFKNSNRVSSFSTSFVFTIVPIIPTKGGHGLAFTISPSTSFLGAFAKQYLGLFNVTTIGNLSNHIFAVEFDTVQDYEFGDINDNHVGVDIDNLNSTVAAPAFIKLAKNGIITTTNVTLQGGNPIQAWIEYDSPSKVLNITLSLSSDKPQIPLISTEIDLSPVLEDYMYVGFSTSTGVLASSHYVSGWTFRMNGEPQPLFLSRLPLLRNTKNITQSKGFISGVSISVTLLVCAAIAASLYIVWKLKTADIIEEWELTSGPHRFSYKELRMATRSFSSKELLGFGGFGKVYRGVLSGSKTVVAVKRVNHESKQGLREFVAEIASVGRMRHRNLVQLQGWCRRRGDLLLVYDYMPNGSLDKYIFEPQEGSVLSWAQRYKVIRGVAAGLLYLHEEWEQVVLHRDVKASNVLLDADMNGRLGDFGLARLYEHGANAYTTHVVGTLGYLAPELSRIGRSTTKTDVYAYGALLLEVACGRRPIDAKAPPEEMVLVDWVWDCHARGQIVMAADSRLRGLYDMGEMEAVLRLGLSCSSSAPEARPSMRQVVQVLDGDAPLPELGLGQVNNDNASRRVYVEDHVHSYPSSMDQGSFASSGGGGTGGGVPLSPLSLSLLSERAGR